MDNFANESNNDATSRKSYQSEIVNPDDKKSQVVTNGNFNIKENMKAGYGIVYKEGRGHVDQGPLYLDMRSDGTQSRTQLTLQEY